MSNQSEIVSSVRAAFSSGITRNPVFRINQLKSLIRLCEENMPSILDALTKDLRKSKQEAVMGEIDYIKNEALGLIYNLNTLTEPEKPEKTIVNMMDKVLIQKEPYGVVLFISPWNYPFQLVFAPLAGAIAAGNCAVIKPSELAPASAKLISELLPKYLDNDCYKVVLGGVPETTELLKLRFDYIFYTGSTSVGRIVYQAAAKFLTPVTLELGGKSPCYLDDTVDVEIAASRIMWGKVLNAGQSCIAPDYLLCSRRVQEKFIEAVRNLMDKWYNGKIKQSPDYARIISTNHFKRIVKLIEGTKIAYGGDYDAQDLYIQPTIVTDVKPNDPIMQDEIFGPVLPIINIENAQDAIKFINNGEKPLALYIFSNKKTDVDLIINNTSSGGVCVNDTMMHFSCPGLPFGGVGESGIGGYHGKYSFETFSHKKGVLIKGANKFGETMQNARYPPYSDKKLNFISTMTKQRPNLLALKSICHIMIFGMGLLTAFAFNYVTKSLTDDKTN